MKKKNFLGWLSLVVMAFVLGGCEFTNQPPQKASYSLTVSCDESQGSVSYSPASSEGKYVEATVVEFVVTPNSGYTVQSFTANDVACTSTSQTGFTYSVTMEKDTNVVVTFSEQKKYFTATIKDTTNGTVSLSQTGSEGYLEGSTVEVKAIANEGYVVKSIKVGGVEIYDADQEKTTFVITSDVEVVVEFTAASVPFSEKALASIQGTMRLDGNYHLDYSTDTDQYYSIVTVFYAGGVYQQETDLSTQQVTYEATLVDQEGKCAIPSINMNNKLVYNVLDEPFADYDNPFKDFTVDDFTWVEENKYRLTKSTKESASAITGWIETIEDFFVYVEDDAVTGIEIKTAEITPDFESDTYVSSYYFLVSDHGTATNEAEITPFERVKEHDDLESALKAITNNYTLKHVDIWEGEEDVVYQVYVDSKSIFSDYELENKDGTKSQEGFVELNGYVYRFSYDGTSITIGDPLSGFETIADVQAIFTSFSVEILQYVGEGTYVAYNSEIARYIATQIGEDYDAQMLGNYATSLAITIKDGALYQIQYTYLVYGQAGKVVLTYENIGTTTVDLDFSKVQQDSVLTAYLGSFSGTDSDGVEHVVEVTEKGITIDKVNFEVLSYDEENGFTGYVGDEVVYLSEWNGTSELYVYYAESEKVFIVSKEQEAKKVEIPAIFKGVWKNDEHKVVVQTNIIFIDGVEYVITDYTEEDGFIGRLGDEVYYMFINEGSLYVAKNDLSDYFILSLTTDSVGIEIPTSYVGTWVDESSNKVTIVITYAGITVNGVPYEITSYDDYYGFNGVLGEVKDYAIGFYYSETKIQVGTMEENYVLTKQETETPDPTEVVIDESHIGTYVGNDEENKEYCIVISKDKITINQEELVLTEYVEASSSYIGTMDNVEYYVILADGKAYLMNDDDTLFVTCEKEVDETTINAAYVGTFKGSAKDVEYVIVGTASSITVNDVEYVVTSFDEVWGYTGTVNGVIFYLYFQGDSLCYVSDDYTISVVLTKDAGGSDPTEGKIDAAYYGTFKGTLGEDEIVVVGSEASITVNGTEYVVTSFDEVWGYVGTLNGAVYYLYFQSSSLYYVSEDYTVSVKLTKETSDDPEPDKIEVKEAYLGTFTGMMGETQYTFVGTEQGITINGVTYVLTAYDDYEGYTGTLDGEEFYCYVEDGGIRIMSSDFRTVNLVLQKVE